MPIRARGATGRDAEGCILSKGVGWTWAVAGSNNRDGAGPEGMGVGRGSDAGGTSPTLTGASGQPNRMYRPERDRYNPWAPRRWFRNAVLDEKRPSKRQWSHRRGIKAGRGRCP